MNSDQKEEDGLYSCSELAIIARNPSDVVILDLKGKICHGESSVALRMSIRAKLDEGFRYILLNCKYLSHIDNSGIGELVSSLASCSKAGVVLKILNLNQKIIDLLAITKLLTTFDLYDDEANALSSFGRA